LTFHSEQSILLQALSEKTNRLVSWGKNPPPVQQPAENPDQVDAIFLKQYYRLGERQL
jgi:hypothetical protein